MEDWHLYQISFLLNIIKTKPKPNLPEHSNLTPKKQTQIYLVQIVLDSRTHPR